MDHSTKLLMILCLGLATVGCVAETDEPEPGSDRASFTRPADVDEDDDSLVSAEPEAQGHRVASEHVVDASCMTEVHLGEGSDWLMDMTVEELAAAPSGYLSVAPLRPSNDPSDCRAEGIVSVRVAQGIAEHVKVSSLCIDEHASADEIVLRACSDDEPSLAAWRMSSLTASPDPTEGACWFCHPDACWDGSTPQRKEGNTGPCIPNFWNTCCWATNAGCC